MAVQSAGSPSYFWLRIDAHQRLATPSKTLRHNGPNTREKIGGAEKGNPLLALGERHKTSAGEEMGGLLIFGLASVLALAQMNGRLRSQSFPLNRMSDEASGGNWQSFAA